MQWWAEAVRVPFHRTELAEYIHYPFQPRRALVRFAPRELSTRVADILSTRTLRRSALSYGKFHKRKSLSSYPTIAPEKSHHRAAENSYRSLRRQRLRRVSSQRRGKTVSHEHRKSYAQIRRSRPAYHCLDPEIAACGKTRLEIELRTLFEILETKIFDYTANSDEIGRCLGR